MPGYLPDIHRPTYVDVSEGVAASAPGGSRPPLDLVRSSAPFATEPLSGSSPSAFEAPPQRSMRAMSPGGTIYDPGASRSTERKTFSAGPARFTTDASGIPIERSTDQQLTSSDILRLSKKDRAFASVKGWVSFGDPLIQSRDDLDRARGAFRSEAARKANEIRGTEGRSAAIRKGHKSKGPGGRSEATRKGRVTLGADGCSEAARKANETRGSEGRSAAIRKGHKSKGAEERARISALANVAYQQRGLERYGGTNAFSEALEDTMASQDSRGLNTSSQDWEDPFMTNQDDQNSYW